MIATSIVLWNASNPLLQKAQSTIDQNLSTSVDKDPALTAAEAVDYAAIASVERFYGSSDPKAYIHSGNTYSYTYANFVDTETINYYQARYDHQRTQISPKDVTLNYSTNVTKLDHVRVFNDIGGIMFFQNKIIPWTNITIVVYDIGKSATVTTADFMVSGAHVFYKNQSEYCALQPEFDLNFSDCYFVEMELEYSEYYAPLSGFMSKVHQIVILDQDLVPVWIGINAFNGIS
jgi:hypothetical protein